MMVIEMREAAQEKAFELLDELHELGHLKKLTLCELEDTLYDCFESDNDESEEKSDEGTDLGFKNKYARHYGMRNFEDDDDKMHDMRSYRRRSMRMRRNKMGRFA